MAIDVLEIPDRGDDDPNATLTHLASLRMDELLKRVSLDRRDVFEFECHANPKPCYSSDLQSFAGIPYSHPPQFIDNSAYAIIHIAVRGIIQEIDLLIRRKELIDVVNAHIAIAVESVTVDWDDWFQYSGVGRIYTSAHSMAYGTSPVPGYKRVKAWANYGQRIASITCGGDLYLKDFNQYDVKEALAIHRGAHDLDSDGISPTNEMLLNGQVYANTEAHLCVIGCDGKSYTSYADIIRTMRENESLPFTETKMQLDETYQRIFMDEEHLICTQTDEGGLVRKIDIYHALIGQSKSSL